jgi:hypothetical protein
LGGKDRSLDGWMRRTFSPRFASKRQAHQKLWSNSNRSGLPVPFGECSVFFSLFEKEEEGDNLSKKKEEEKK